MSIKVCAILPSYCRWLIDSNTFFIEIGRPNNSWTRSHAYKLCTHYCHFNTRKHVFCNCVLNV